MQFLTIAVLSYLSIITITAHPFSSERRNPKTRDIYNRARFSHRLAARDASPFTIDDVRQGTHHTMDHVRHTVHNQTVAAKVQAHKYAPTAKKYESGTEMAVCAVGAFIPVVDIAIDSACLGLVAAKGGHALYKHAHNHTSTGKHSEPTHDPESRHFDPSQHKQPPHHTDLSQHPEPSHYKRDLYIRSMRAYWNSL